ncbi:uncharacterized protein LOC121638579 isoform X2 [Melanotaenia boesemani]|uniref:uncharacterized protein LOC121638579 isoform X2 n=1 Tax=Melanotaenia boesemani TaxID=1250792 RepID=UPI001C05E62F|nr:uncharacterized protein LOC121638579 isoform X2 [Melanotaenia boesemani]
MLLSEAKWMVMAFIACISGAVGQNRTICVFRGSSVNLTCLAEHTAKRSWYVSNGSIIDLNEFSANGNDAAYKLSEDDNFTLTITKVRESDENTYCCRKTTDKTDFCWNSAIKLRVADLQVKVFPTTDRHAVTLMCSTSCPLTETPTAFIWYKNREFLYEDWSPWYQELVTSQDAVKYSCAIKDYVNVRAPEVSVDSVTPNCFSVTYAKGKICSDDLKSVDRPCSITYAKDIHVQLTSVKKHIILTCNTSCPAADPLTAFEWYYNRKLFNHCKSQDITVTKSEEQIFSCAVKDNEALHSDEICIYGASCEHKNYVSRRICALEGSSVNISSVYSYISWSTKLWYKIIRNAEEDSGAAALVEASGHAEFHADEKNKSTLRINDLRKNDSAEYMFCLQGDEICKRSAVPGVMLIVTGLRVTIIPSAEVTEGQRVTLTCSTSCPLAENITYIWFLNNQNLSIHVNQNKHMVLDPVSIQHEGNYSCAVSSSQFISSPEQALMVKAHVKSVAIMNAVKLVVFLLILSVVFKFCLMTRKRKTVTATAEQREKEQTEQTHYMRESHS